MLTTIKDAHLTKKSVLISRGIIKEDNAENIRYQADLPRGFSLNLCGHCTYKCSFCPQSLSANLEEYINPGIIYKVFDELGNRAVYVQMGSRGESLLHPEFFKFIRFIKDKNKLSYICLSTNGYIIDDRMTAMLIKSGIDHIVFSLQTINPLIYKKITGSSHHRKVIDRIIEFKKKINRECSKIFLSVQFLAFPDNLPYRQEFIDFWQPHNIGIQIQNLHSWGGRFHLTETVSDEQRYPCPYLWLYPTITHTGKLTTCFTDFNEDMAYGSLDKETLASLWRGEKARLIREKHLHGKWRDISMCRNCSGFRAMGNGFKRHEDGFVIA